MHGEEYGTWSSCTTMDVYSALTMIYNVDLFFIYNENYELYLYFFATFT